MRTCLPSQTLTKSRRLPAIEAAQVLINRLGVFEQPAAGYVVAHPVNRASFGEVAAAPRPTRLQSALAGWDIQVHRTPAANPEGQVVVVPKVADRGDSHGESLLRGTLHPLQYGGVILGLEMGHRLVRGVEHQVLVHVDEARKQRHIAKINDITGIRP
jgi:hypothetical protein